LNRHTHIECHDGTNITWRDLIPALPKCKETDQSLPPREKTCCPRFFGRGRRAIIRIRTGVVFI
jgi:hypothetical protein